MGSCGLRLILHLHPVRLLNISLVVTQPTSSYSVRVRFESKSGVTLFSSRGNDKCLHIECSLPFWSLRWCVDVASRRYHNGTQKGVQSGWLTLAHTPIRCSYTLRRSITQIVAIIFQSDDKKCVDYSCWWRLWCWWDVLPKQLILNIIWVPVANWWLMRERVRIPSSCSQLRYTTRIRKTSASII